MGARPLDTTAIVLERAESGEHWLRLTCHSPEHGHLDCLQRLSRKNGPAAAPLDLFDEAQLALETRNEGRTWFVRDVVLYRRRTALGGSYETLRHACRFARILARNPVSEDSREAVAALLHRALDAWETHRRPDAVYFKSIYLLAREEGYPVREDWWPRLASTDREMVEAILREPSSGQSTSVEDMSRLAAALESYIRHETDLTLDDDR